MLSPHAEKCGDASPPRPPPIDARANYYNFFIEGLHDICTIIFIDVSSLFVTFQNGRTH